MNLGLPDSKVQTYGRLSVTGVPYSLEYGTKGKRARFVECQCSCGNVSSYRLDHLKSGASQSCGCLQREQTSKSNKKHGHSSNKKTSPEYYTWRAMIDRCGNQNVSSYPNYGGRGIVVCDRWMKFENFLEDMGTRPNNRMTLDRVDVNGDYCPVNCRWATRKQQSNNTRRNCFVKAFGKTQTVSQWADEVGIDYSVLALRLHRLKWPVEKALTTKVRPLQKPVSGITAVVERDCLMPAKEESCNEVGTDEGRAAATDGVHRGGGKGSSE